MYDGITGLVTQPVRGAKKSGVEGFIKGVGKGIVGVVVKPGAGIYGLPGFAMKGVYQEIQKRYGSSVNNYIIASRTAQGYAELAQTTREQRKEVATKYLEVQYEEQKKRSGIDEQVEIIQQRWQNRKDRRRLEKEVKAKAKGKQRLTGDVHASNVETEQSMAETLDNSASNWPLQQSVSSHSTSRLPELAELADSAAVELPADKGLAQVEHFQHYADAHDDELEQAIRMSIQQTSRGNEHEDELIANAIRASLMALEDDRRKDVDEDQALQRAVAASVHEASKSRPEGISEEEYNKTLEQVLQQSVLDQTTDTWRPPRRVRSSDSEWDDSSDDYASTDHDENFHRALEETVAAPARAQNDAEEDEDLKKALAESSLTPGPTRTEQDADEELAKALEESKRVTSNTLQNEGDDDEELRRAMEESMLEGEREHEAEAKRKHEDEVIMRYVEKQSLLEEEARRKRLQGFGEEPQRGESSGGWGGGGGGESSRGAERDDSGGLS